MTQQMYRMSLLMGFDLFVGKYHQNWIQIRRHPESDGQAIEALQMM
jgi:hypothetical protein